MHDMGYFKNLAIIRQDDFIGRGERVDAFVTAMKHAQDNGYYIELPPNSSQEIVEMFWLAKTLVENEEINE